MRNIKTIINSLYKNFIISTILLLFIVSIIINIPTTKNNVIISSNYDFLRLSNNNISLSVDEIYSINISTNLDNLSYEVSDNSIIKLLDVDNETINIKAINPGHTDIVFTFDSQDYILNIHVNDITPAENYVNNIINIAYNELGYKEKQSNQNLNSKTTNSGTKNYTKYGKWYGINPGKWCAMFISWCANEANISKSIIPNFASVAKGMEWFKNNNLFRNKTGYTPKPGDIIFFKSNGASHTGLVIKSDGNYVYTIEGNTSNSVGMRYYKLNYNKITGYGTPDYPRYYNFNYNYDTSKAVSGHSNSTS